MTRDDAADVLIRLIRCVPVYAINPKAAEDGGDYVGLAYARAIAAWRHQAAQTIAEIRQGNTAHARHAPPDAFDRIAAASALMQIPPAE